MSADKAGRSVPAPVKAYLRMLGSNTSKPETYQSHYWIWIIVEGCSVCDGGRLPTGVVTVLLASMTRLACWHTGVKRIGTSTAEKAFQSLRRSLRNKKQRLLSIWANQFWKSDRKHRISPYEALWQPGGLASMTYQLHPSMAHPQCRMI